jgi:hypothetical protein
MTNTIKLGDVVSCDRAEEPHHQWQVLSYNYLDTTLVSVKDLGLPGTDSLQNRAHKNHDIFWVHLSRISPIPPPSNGPLYLYMVTPIKRNWMFTGYHSIVVVADSPETAARISPYGDLITTWPVEGWAVCIRDLSVLKIGSADHYLKENTVVSTSYSDE